MENKYFIHEDARVASKFIGDETQIWQFVVVLGKAKIGKNCNINAHVFIENDVEIGDNVTIKSGVQIWDGITIENNVFVGPNVTFCNDNFPRSKQHLSEYPKTIICEGASIGANSTILPGVIIGRNVMIGAGSVVTRDVPPNAVVAGNPARITRYIQSNSDNFKSDSNIEFNDQFKFQVNGVKIHKLPKFRDLRGSLSVFDFKDNLPFVPKRTFMTYEVDNSKVRGEHAHKTCHQFLVAVKGSVSVVVSDLDNLDEVRLTTPEFGLHLPPLVWGTQYKFSSDCVLLVFASEHYDSNEYIRSHQEYLEYMQKLRK